MVADTFCHAGFTVLRCNLAFRQARPQGPPPRGCAPQDQEGLQAAVFSLRKLLKGHKTPASIFLGGHSYGGRMASMLAAAHPRLVEGVLLLSYPLHPPNRPEVLRTAHFPLLQTPALFVQGTRDGFGSIKEMTAACTCIPAPTELLAIEGGEHALLSKNQTAKNETGITGQQALAMKILDAFLSFHCASASV